MKIKKIIILMFVLMLCIPISLAYTTYPELGRFSGRYHSDISFFTSLNEDVTYANSQGLTDSQKAPLVEDLDGDGTKEVVLLDDNDIKVYTGSSLTINNSYSLTGSRFSNMIIFDIDGDSYKEVIISSAQTTEELWILEFNGTHFYNESTLSWNTALHSTGDVLIKCGDTNDCLMSYGLSYSPVVNIFYARSFDSTSVGIETVLLGSAGSTINCFPSSPNMVYADYDGDNEEEYIFNVLRVYSASSPDPHPIEEMVTFAVYNHMNTSINREQYISYDIVNYWGNGGIPITTCEDQDAGKIITNPLVFDFETIGGDLEIMSGYMNSLTTFAINAFDSDFSEIDTWEGAELLGVTVDPANANWLSNMFRSNLMFNSESYDSVCVLGVYNDSLQYQLMCANPSRQCCLHDIGIWTYEFGSNADLTDFSTLVHSLELSGGTGTDGILTTYGTFDVDSVGSGYSGDLEIQYVNPLSDGVAVSVDIDGVGWEDIIYMTPTRVYMMDDGYSFTGANIDESTSYTDPCFDQPLKVSDANDDNVSRQLLAVAYVNDADNDQVMSRLTFYADSVHNQTSGWFPLENSPGDFPFRFDINVTTAQAIFRVEANDTSNPTEIDTYEDVVAVSTSGLEEGDCVGLFTPEAEELTPEEQELVDFQENNSIVTTIDTLLDAGGMSGFPKSLVWLIVMATIGGILAWNGFAHHNNPQVVLATVGIVLSIVYLIGYALGFVPIAYFIGVVLIAMAIVAFKIAKPTITGD